MQTHGMELFHCLSKIIHTHTLTPTSTFILTRTIIYSYTHKHVHTYNTNTFTHFFPNWLYSFLKHTHTYFNILSPSLPLLLNWHSRKHIHQPTRITMHNDKHTLTRRSTCNRIIELFNECANPESSQVFFQIRVDFWDNWNPFLCFSRVMKMSLVIDSNAGVWYRTHDYSLVPLSKQPLASQLELCINRLN